MPIDGGHVGFSICMPGYFACFFVVCQLFSSGHGGHVGFSICMLGNFACFFVVC